MVADIATADSNLLVNGSFEATALGVGKAAGFQSIAGWTALTGGTIELWNAVIGVTATQGVNFAELDYLGGYDGELSPNFGDGLRVQAAAVWDFEDAGLAATSIPSVNLTP